MKTLKTCVLLLSLCLMAPACQMNRTCPIGQAEAWNEIALFAHRTGQVEALTLDCSLLEGQIRLTDAWLHTWGAGSACESQHRHSHERQLVRGETVRELKAAAQFRHEQESCWKQSSIASLH